MQSQKTPRTADDADTWYLELETDIFIALWVLNGLRTNYLKWVQDRKHTFILFSLSANTHSVQVLAYKLGIRDLSATFVNNAMAMPQI